jgi:phosphoglycerol transferase MdoB-like AlkP superfamily enzyme
MSGVKHNIKQLLLRLGLAFLTFFIARLLFLVLNKTYFPDINLNVFFYGMRFDWVAISYLFLPFIILHILPVSNYEAVWRKKSLRLLFHTGNFIGLFLNFIDVIYYNFVFKRSTYDLFESMGDDAGRLLPIFIKDFWYMIIIYAVVVYGIDLLYKKTIKPSIDSSSEKQWVAKTLVFVFFGAIAVIGARGGTQLKPLSIPDGGKYTTAQNIPVLVNTPFTIFLSIQIGAQQEFSYFDKGEAEKIYSPIQKVEGKGPFKNRNVVMLILESFATEYVGFYNNGKGYTPFLDSLLGESYVFVNNRSNGQRSIEALPALFAGIPNLTQPPYILSVNATNQIYAFPHRLKELGYNSSFYHGGENGTMSFDAFCGLAGVDKYYGIDEYPNKERDYDGNWGIFDEPYFQYFADELKQKKQPFFSALFTLSSHHPYAIPEKYSNKFPTGKLNVFETIGYTDFALKQFFESVKNEAWYENTIFVITADHTAQCLDKYYIKSNGRFKVPLAFFDPQGEFKGVNTKMAKHSDLPSTLLSMLGDTVDVLNFGQDLLSKEKSFSVNASGGYYYFRSDSMLIQFDGEQSKFAWLESDSLLKNNLRKSAVLQPEIDAIIEKGKSYLQQYSERINQGKMLPK